VNKIEESLQSGGVPKDQKFILLYGFLLLFLYTVFEKSRQVAGIFLREGV
jgi:hypothetical protein